MGVLQFFTSLHRIRTSRHVWPEWQLEERVDRHPTSVNCRHSSGSNHNHPFGRSPFQFPQKRSFSRSRFSCKKHIHSRIFQKVIRQFQLRITFHESRFYTNYHSIRPSQTRNSYKGMKIIYSYRGNYTQSRKPLDIFDYFLGLFFTNSYICRNYIQYHL